MNKKEKLFCNHYAKLQNYEEAAKKAGFKASKSENVGINLLLNPAIKSKIELILKEDKNTNLIQEVIAGLKRLAFGSIDDAVKLVFAESLQDVENLTNLNLFNVSEIKKLKGGGCEIKFFDRLNALNKILEISTKISESNEGTDLFDAIKESSEAINNNEVNKREEDYE